MDMLVWSSNIYLDEKIARRRKKYEKSLKKRRQLKSIYCITLPVNGKNMMEIYSSGELWFQYYREQKLTLIGLAKTMEGAQKLVAQICLDRVREDGDVTPEILRNYFEDSKEEGV